MFRKSYLLLVVASTLIGCTASSMQPSDSSAKASAASSGSSASSASATVSHDETAQLAAYSASAHLPENSNFRTDLNVATILDRNGGIQIYNFTDKPLSAGNIWINRVYVQQFDTVPAKGHISLSRGKFYDRTGVSLASTNERIQAVDLQWDKDVYTLLGPVQE